MYADKQSADPEAAELALVSSEIMRLLADPTRLQIAWLLVEREHPVGELSMRIGKPASGISQHLAKLRMAHLVTATRMGTNVYYRIDDEHIAHLVTEIRNYAEHLTSDRPAHHR